MRGSLGWRLISGGRVFVSVSLAGAGIGSNILGWIAGSWRTMWCDLNGAGRSVCLPCHRLREFSRGDQRLGTSGERCGLRLRNRRCGDYGGAEVSGRWWTRRGIFLRDAQRRGPAAAETKHGTITGSSRCRLYFSADENFDDPEVEANVICGRRAGAVG